MEHYYIPLELTKKLQEKGMPMPNQLTFGTYKNKKVVPCKVVGLQFDIALAPTIEQILAWLRCEKKIHIATGVTPKSQWRYVIMFCDERGLNEPTITEKNHQDYQSAIIAGIEYVTDNLI